MGNATDEQRAKIRPMKKGTGYVRKFPQDPFHVGHQQKTLIKKRLLLIRIFADHQFITSTLQTDLQSQVDSPSASKAKQ